MKNVQALLKRISNHEAMEIAKPWLVKAGIATGLKSLYDVPEYFREKLELKGLKIGKKEFGGGLAGATADLLEKNKTVSEEQTGRSELYRKISLLEKAGQTDSVEYEAIKKQLDDTRSTAVKDAIEKVNKKLALTKEGNVKNSEARKEMARILREQRKKKQLNREVLKGEINQTLDNYTTQKVDGVTAAREALRTALTVTGTRQFMSLGNIALDGASFVKQASQKAQLDGQAFNTDYIAKQVAEAARKQWSEIKGLGSSSDPEGKAAVISKISDVASKYGLAGGEVGSIAQLGAQAMSRMKPRFNKNKIDSSSTKVSVGNLGNTTSNTQLAQPSASATQVEKKPIPPPTARKEMDTSDNTPPSETSVPTNSNRVKTSDRSYLNKPFFSGKTATGAGRVTTDQKFSAGYAKKGLQPSGLGNTSQIKNVRVKDKYAENPLGEAGVVTGEDDVAANDPYYEPATVTPIRRPSATPTRSKLVKQQAQGMGMKVKAKNKKRLRRKAKVVYRALLGPFWFSYVGFQLPFAILSLVFFGLAFIAEEIRSFFDAEADDGWFTAGVKFFGRTLERAFQNIFEGIAFFFKELTGIDLEAAVAMLDPLNILMVFLVIIFAYSLILMFIVGMAYQQAGISCLFGRGSGAKIGAFIMCLGGYFMPLFNLVPWVFLWMWVIKRNPG